MKAWFVALFLSVEHTQACPKIRFHVIVTELLSHWTVFNPSEKLQQSGEFLSNKAISGLVLSVIGNDGE